jgi:hypothetical protein
MEQEFALRRGGVHLLGQRNVPPRVFRYRRAPLPHSRRRRSRRNSVASAQRRSRSVRLCYKNGPFVSSGLVGAHTALGTVLFNQGKLEPALAQYRRGFEMFDPNMQFPDWPGSRPGVTCRSFPAIISWMLGYPDQSLNELRAAVRSAETLGHPLNRTRRLISGQLLG